MQRDPRRVLVSCVTLLLNALAVTASAQILERPVTQLEPRVWMSASAGALDIARLSNGESAWDFGTGLVYRASLEHTLGRGSAIGLAGWRSRIPLRATNAGLVGSTSVDAHATVSSIMATFRGGGGSGFHQVFEVQAGALRFTGVEADDSNDDLVDSGSSTDFAFSVGGGFGFTVNPRFAVALVQEWGLILHRGQGSSDNSNNSAQQRVTRLGVRYGLGNTKGK